MEAPTGNQRPLKNVLHNRKLAALTATYNAKNNAKRGANNVLLQNARMANNTSQLAAQLRRAEAQLSHLNHQPSESELAAELRKVQRFNSMMSQTRKGGRKNRRKTRRNNRRN